MSLPLLISVPHAGLGVPPEVASINLLTTQQIIEDGDEGAAEMYAVRDHVQQFVTTDIARAFVDMNRPEADRRSDGVVKTHTCWDVPVYGTPLSDEIVNILLERYYHPYHARLRTPEAGIMLGLDCHTMAAVGPRIGPMPGQERPAICISNAGETCPSDWLELMVDCFAVEFDQRVTVNSPFKGGYIIRSHAAEMPWMQVEISRAPFMNWTEKRDCFRQAVARWCEQIPG
ncbi:MAG: N-formylglutamate amidohydrolase [Candidatus Zixiibacteriota bacterium]|nr:MAG: N-formylglutamate amidohydrolase [candidate division Zixibacteria bacterium]